MRVIAGSARRLALKTVEGMATRPTTDRIKETLFNMLQNQIPGRRFLDLFSGSGAIAIEALSRGAREAVLVENQAAAVACTRENLRTTRLEDRAQVMACDVEAALKRLEAGGEAFDIIFMDPPYDRELERRVLTYLSDSCLADEDTLIIAEASLDTDFSYLGSLGFELLREKTYKTNKHVFVSKGELS